MYLGVLFLEMFMFIFFKLEKQLLSVDENDMFFEEIGALSKATIVQEPSP